MNLKKLSKDLKNFEGLRRKTGIGGITGILEKTGPNLKSFFGDDAAVLDFNGSPLLFACDSINEKLIIADPFFAGYSAVLVNVNDIAAMGGIPHAMVNVISAMDESCALEMVRGISAASEKFGVPVVGGHYNPNTKCNGIDISIIGRAYADRMIRGSIARPGDAIFIAIDLEGSLHKKYDLAWDSTSKKTSAQVQKNLSLLMELAEKSLVVSGRDISNPGIIGTLGMLLENSGSGGIVYLDKIPKPDQMELSHWLKIYPGFGFVFTAPESIRTSFKELFESNGISTALIGRVIEGVKLFIKFGEDEEEVFDFSIDEITGI